MTVNGGDGGDVGEVGGAAQQDVAVWRPRHGHGIEVVRGSTLSSTPRHFHEELEIGLKQGGGWEFHHGGVWHTVAPGTLVLTPPGAVHMMRSPHGADDAMYHGLRLDANLLRRVATDITGHPQHDPDFGTPLVQGRDTQHLFLRLVAALADGSTASPLAQESWLHDALGHLVLRHGAEKLVSSPVGREDGAIRRVRQYLEEHAERTVTLTELADVAQLSTFYLCRVFGTAVGMPPHAYQTQVRVVRAKTLLVAGRLSLAQIATEVGFASQSHFTRHFARLVGVTPGQYVRDRR